MSEERCPQRQDSLYDQMITVLTLATRAGCYDAADWIADAYVNQNGNFLGTETYRRRSEA